MKFDFEKQKITSHEENPDMNEAQEKFDLEIIKEAEKLGTNIEKLTAEIDALGGPEKFQEIFSEKYNSPREDENDITRGGDMVKSKENYANLKKAHAKNFAFIASLLAGISATIGVIAVAKGESAPLENSIPAALAAIVAGAISLKFKLIERVEKRKAKRMELKMKMTDTPHRIIEEHTD